MVSEVWIEIVGCLLEIFFVEVGYKIKESISVDG